jgi:heat induced stress protein YflT
MTMNQRSTVVGVFADRVQAEQAVTELRRLGFTDDQIGHVARDARGTSGMVTPGETAERAAVGAASGGVAGGIIGAAASLLIPGVGPAIAGGILAATLGGVVVGAATGGIVGALTSMGVSEEEACYYQGEFEAGRTIVTVNAPGQEQAVKDVLRRFGAYDATTRPGSYA